MAITKGTEGALYLVSALGAFAGKATSEYTASSKIFQIKSTSNRLWSPDTTIVASAGTIDKSWQDSGIDYFQGRVKLTTSQQANGALSGMTLSGENATALQVVYVHSWALNASSEIGEVTSIGDAWRKLVALGKKATITFNRWMFSTEKRPLSAMMYEQPVSTLASRYWLIKIVESGTAGYWAKCKFTGWAFTKSTGGVDDVAVTLEVDSVIPRAT